MTFLGQYGQPIYTKEVLKKHGLWHPEKQGFFVEAGAGGGELFSNSLYFEAKHNWTGLLVEPNPDWWKELTEVAGEGGPDLAPQKILLSQ